MISSLQNKTIMIVGGTGSLGSAILEFLIEEKCQCSVYIFSRDEYKQHQQKQLFRASPFDINYIIGDIRNPTSIRSSIRKARPNIIFNTAALKHIDLSEENPYEYVQTNISGVHNLIETVLDIGGFVETVLCTSTDKAVAPVNVMGMTKAIQERMMIEANNRSNGTKFICSRYGNVIGSRGSLIEIIKELMKEKKDIYLTNPECTRFFLTLREGVELIINACDGSIPGGIYVPKMNSFKIIDIIEIFIENFNSKSKIITIGMRPGERVYEVIISPEEGIWTMEEENHYVILPYNMRKEHDKGSYINRAITTTDKITNKDKLRQVFADHLI